MIVAGAGANITEATKSHDANLEKFLNRCVQKGIVLNAEKFVLRQPAMEFMGHIIGVEGIQPDPAKVEAIINMPNPTGVTSTRRFLGMVNYLAKFVPHLTMVAKPIQELVRQDVVWQWGPQHEAATRKLKSLLSTAPVLAHYNAAKPLIVQCDASKSGLGVALMQGGRPIAYASRALTEAEENYAQIEKELLSIVYGMQKFHQFTYGRPVTIHNDHKPLQAIQKKPLSKVPMRLQRMLMRLNDYNYTIIHVPGRDMHLADTLSRAYPEAHEKGTLFDHVNTVIVTDLTAAELSELQVSIDKDSQLCELREAILNGWPENKVDCPPVLTPYWDFRDELSVCQNVIIKGQTIVVPQNLRPKYLKLCHTAHQGADSCLRRARQSVFWPGMTADVKTVVEKCEVCAKAAPRQQQQPLQQPETPSKAWSRVSADIMTVDGKQYLVTVDNLSGYLEIDLLRAQTSWEVILKLRMTFARFGPPEVLITDNGPQFTSAQFAAFAQSWRFQHRTSSPHYPRSNGQAEAAVKVAKAIMTKAKHSGTDVYMALLDYRNTPHSSTNLSPVEVMLNRKTRTATLPQYQPPTTIDHKAATAKSKHQRVVKASHDKHVRELQPLQIGEKVWFTEFAGNKEKWSRGHIKEVHPSSRSYIIEAPSSGTYVRIEKKIHRKPTITQQ